MNTIRIWYFTLFSWKKIELLKIKSLFLNLNSVKPKLKNYEFCIIYVCGIESLLNISQEKQKKA